MSLWGVGFVPELSRRSTSGVGFLLCRHYLNATCSHPPTGMQILNPQQRSSPANPPISYNPAKKVTSDNLSRYPKIPPLPNIASSYEPAAPVPPSYRSPNRLLDVDLGQSVSRLPLLRARSVISRRPAESIHLPSQCNHRSENLVFCSSSQMATHLPFMRHLWPRPLVLQSAAAASRLPHTTSHGPRSSRPDS
ncbi:hypothetical protein LZ30DRAFT_428499 [Colletotrichum cereale]|nr:hypothetical protein LZ30DRAFT_428499 [Colletotrichum cereale]